nr:hypothetical protein [Tanacetum cinerariifolium]
MCYFEKENSSPCVSKPNSVEEFPKVFNPPPQHPIYSCEFCGSNARYGHCCTPQVPLIYPEPGVLGLLGNGGGSHGGDVGRVEKEQGRVERCCRAWWEKKVRGEQYFQNVGGRQ